MFKYSYDNEVFEVDRDLIPENSLLRIIHTNSNTEIANSTDPNLPYVIYYIKNRPIVSDKHTIAILNYWDVYRDYGIIYKDEKFMRVNMYNPEYAEHQMNTDKYYRLSSMDAFADEYQTFIDTYTKPTNIISVGLKHHNLTSYETVIRNIQNIEFIFDSARTNNVDIIIAGKSIFELLMVEDNIQFEYSTREYPWEFHTTQVDIFIIGSDLYDIANCINVIGSKVESIYEDYGVYNDEYVDDYDYDLRELAIVSCIRTAKSMSIIVKLYDEVLLRLDIQLKLYKTYSEVLHGFDVDCECIGWDGKTILATERAKYALFHNYNTVNPDFISTLYENSLYKYAMLNMSIDTSYAELSIFGDISGEIESFIRRLKDKVKPGFRVYKSRAQIPEYPLYINSIKEIVRGNRPLIAQLRNVLRNGGWDRQTVTKLGSNQYDFDIRCYDILNSIILVSSELELDNVVSGLTINSTVYKMMQIVGNVQITEGVTFVVTNPGQEVTNNI